MRLRAVARAPEYIHGERFAAERNARGIGQPSEGQPDCHEDERREGHHDGPGEARKGSRGAAEESLLRQIRREDREAAADQPGRVSATRRVAGEKPREARYLIFARLAGGCYFSIMNPTHLSSFLGSAFFARN